MRVDTKRNRKTADKILFMIDLIQDEMLVREYLRDEHNFKKRLAYKKLIFLLKQERKNLK